MRRRRKIHPDFDVVKENLKYLFQDLRKQGYVAKVNFSCCSSCGSYECRELAIKQKKTKIVFYHRQGEEGLKYNGNVYLHHFTIVGDENLQDASDKSSAEQIVDIAKKYPAIVTEWSGDVNKCILIKRA